MLDILVTTAHPDDAEFAMGGSILKFIAMGQKVGICDLTAGELGTRGSPTIRAAEAAVADRLMGLTVRVNCGFKDGFFDRDEAHLLAIIKQIRRFRPRILCLNPLEDRHPDHGRAGAIVKEAAFLSGLSKIETFDDTGVKQEIWRPKTIMHYIMGTYHKPDFIVDISAFWHKKIEVMKAYESQFKSEKYAQEPQTILTRDDFWSFIEARDRMFAGTSGIEFAEGFLTTTPPMLDFPLVFA
jgi:bacillithiol biosynthesis deacetylase BshB1